MTVDALKEIEDLVAFEGRAPGTDAERRAAVHLERRLRGLGRDAETEPTRIHPNYPVTHALHALIAIVGSVLSVTVPVAGAALVLVATVSAFGDLSGSFHIVRRLTGRRASQNVTSTEGGQKPGIVILTAHYDAGRGGALFSPRAVERRATLGRLLRRGLGPFEPFFWSMLAILVCTVLRLIGLDGTLLTVVQFLPTVVLIASIPLLVDIALSDVQEGANDNASGVATALRLAERYGGRLEHFDVWVVLPGGDRGLMLGMRQWIRRHKGDLDPERTIFLNVEGAGTGTVRWIEKEGLVAAMRYHPTLVELCEQIGDGRGMTSREATSALAPRAAGFPAITITARNALDYAPERIDAESLERTYDFCGALLERLDESIGPEFA
jgi:plasmid stabilization system protein ParE